jgi:hypothetical protein
MTHVLVLIFLSCTQAPVVPPGDWANVAPARVEEVLHGEGRAYLRVVEGQYTFWASVPETTVDVGEFVLLGKGPLRYAEPGAGRLFDALTVIEQVAVVDAAVAYAAARLPVAEGGRDIAAIYRDRTSLAGQRVRVRGRVVKASKNIEGTNWYHLRDGSAGPGAGEDDLTFTSKGDHAVGDVVVIEGPLTLDKDLGFGYFYAAILENPTVTEEAK